MRKKILIVACVFPPEPVVSANLMFDLAQNLSADFDVTVIRPRPTRPLGFNLPDFVAPEEFSVVTVEDSFVCPESSLVGRLRESLSFGSKVVDYVDAHKDQIDLIYNAAWPLYGMNMVAKVAVRHNIPYIATVQDIYPESILSKLPKWGVLKSLVNGLFLSTDIFTQKNAAAIHTISDAMADYLSHTRGVGRSNYLVVKNWQNARDFIEFRKSVDDMDSSGRPFTFMYLGNVGPLAGLETVIEAFGRYESDSRLVIAGSGSAKDALRRMAQGNPRIEFWDVPAGQVPATQHKADVMVLPVRKGFASSSIPSKLPAYMFSARPVLCAVDSGSDTAACIREAGGGWVVEAEDAEALAIQMEACEKTGRDTLMHMGKRNFDYAVENFSREKGVAKLSGLFRKILSRTE